MSSFAHYLEKEVLQDHIKQDGLFMGLSRTNGVRNITENATYPGFAEWDNDPDDPGSPPDKIIVTDGIDEPGEGWVWDEDTTSWVTEASLDLADDYDRVAVGTADWHDVEVVLGTEGDSELRLDNDVTFPEAGSDEDWGTVTHFFIADSATIGEGNILAYGQLPDSVHIIDGMTAKIWGNTIVVRMTD